MLTAVVIVAILAASWFLLVSPKRSDAAELRSQATKQQASNDALVQQLRELKAQSLDLPKQKAQLAIFAKEIPNNPALPSLVRDLTAAGKKVGITIVSMKPGTPTAVAAPVPVAPVATTSTTDSTTADGTTPPAPAAAAPAAPSLYIVPLSVDISGSYFEVEQFVNKLEGLQRRFLLTGFTLKTNDAVTAGASTNVAPGDLTLSFTGQVFLSPNVAATTSTSAAAPATAPAN